jgi:hypothetical protein
VYLSTRLGAAKDFNPKIAVEISLLSLARGSAFPRAEMPEELEWFKLSYRHKVQEKNNSNLTRKTERWESRFGLLQAACKANQIPGRVCGRERWNRCPKGATASRVGSGIKPSGDGEANAEIAEDFQKR